VKIATFNINSIRGRLPRLLEWLAEARPDVVCLQELRILEAEFPVAAIRDAGYGAMWRGQKSRYNGVAVLARGTDPVAVRRELPGDPKDSEARYLEAAVNGILIGCLYAPNGNPQPGPKFDSARLSLGKEDVAVVDRNLSLESRGFDSLPAKVSHRPEASLAWVVVTQLVKRRQRIPKPRY
jgi:exodeoxyribonuclease III